MTFNKTKYDNDYQKEKYDRIVVNVPKGKKAIIKTHMQKVGYDSMNEYIKDLIEKDISSKSQVTQVNNGIIGTQIGIIETQINNN